MLETDEVLAPTEGRCDPEVLFHLAAKADLQDVLIIGKAPDGTLALWGSDDSTATNVLLLERAKKFFMDGYDE